jgi:excisionase family DNA binding protein
MTSDTLLSPLDRRKTLSVAEVAEALGIDKQTVRRDARTGAIPGGFQRKPWGQWRFKRDILEDWWAKQGLKGSRRL